MANIDDDTIKKFAVQTAVLFVLIEELVENGVIEKQSLVNRLYELLQEFSETEEKLHNAGAIRHLISLLEGDD